MRPYNFPKSDAEFVETDTDMFLRWRGKLIAKRGPTEKEWVALEPGVEVRNSPDICCISADGVEVCAFTYDVDPDEVSDDSSDAVH